MTSFATSGHVRLDVTLAGGEVTVDAVNATGSVEIELVPLRDNEATRQAIAEARVEMTDRGDAHEIVVEVQKKSGFVIGRGVKVGVQIRCPEGSDLRLRSAAADLQATGALGFVTAKTASGDISIDDASRLDVETASGDVRARDLDGPFDGRTASGDIAIRRCFGPFEARLVSGDLSVGEAAAGLSVTTVSGDVRFDSAGGGAMRVQAVSGDVHLAIAPGEQLYIDASSVSGSMSSSLGVEDAPAEGGPVHEVRVRTVSGDLELVRAAGVRVQA